MMSRRLAKSIASLTGRACWVSQGDLIATAEIESIHKKIEPKKKNSWRRKII
jgi:hypothetical protein